MSETVHLPPKYYLTYFDYLIGFVEDMYGHLLTEEEIRFLEAYRELPEDAKCLFIRMSNRKGFFFRPSSFSYPEIADIGDSLANLTQRGFVRYPDSLWEGHIDLVLGVLTKPELLEVTRVLDPVIMPSKSIKRADLVRWLAFEYAPTKLLDAVLASQTLVYVEYSREVALMKFLFFGNRHDDMTEFVIRDLGHVRFQSFDDQSLSRKFTTRKEVEDALTVSYLREEFVALCSSSPPDEVFDWLMHNYSELAESISLLAKPSLDQLVLKAAGWLERKKMPAQALEFYHLTTTPPARERKVRLMHRLGYYEEALQLCVEMLNSPQNADELYFGQDFSAKMTRAKKRVVRQTTLALHDAETILLSEAFKYQVEYGAANHFSQIGYHTFFSENTPWRSLFGLLFWEVIYDTNVQAIHHPLQRVPSDFFLPDFYQKRAHLLRAEIARHETIYQVKSTLVHRFAAKYGTANVLVGWHEELLNQLVVICDLLSLEQIQRVMMEMATDLRDKTRGFPDLLIWNTDEYAFVEIKSPTDHLSARQLYWQHFFKEIGISSKIVKVKWDNQDIHR
jgi:hypothetical protein